MAMELSKENKEFVEEKTKERRQEKARDAERVQATKELLLRWRKEVVEVSFPFGDKDIFFKVRARLGRDEARKFKPIYASLSPLGFLAEKNKKKGRFEFLRKDNSEKRLEKLIQEFCTYLVVEPKLGLDYWKKAPDELGALIIATHLRASQSVFTNIADIKPFREEPRRKSPK